MKDTRIGYMDKIDFDFKLGECNETHGAAIWPSITSLRRDKKCLAMGSGCGIVKVETRLLEVIENTQSGVVLSRKVAQRRVGTQTKASREVSSRKGKSNG